ncbi:unnamed protein product [Durusdinium trenchii]|uniref:Ketoreductase (KR) domain-containing protein n=1 Tax=Durusdinium trenchii TaxID=1381693 RepID=A0ABP0PNX1_9DINO
MAWVLITGGGTGIGRGLVHHFSSISDLSVLTCGRRAAPLAETRRTAPRPEAITIVACDLGTAEGRHRFLEPLPPEASVRLLVQNAAIGDPAAVAELDLKHFEELCRAGALCSVE